MNYDPKNLGAYVPVDARTIEDVAEHIAWVRKKSRLIAWEEIAKNDVYSKEERDEIISVVGREENKDLYISKYTWVYLRDRLVNGFIQAFCVDENGRTISIDQEFWANDFAVHVLSSGHLNIPMFRPKGVVYISLKDRTKIALEAFDVMADLWSDDNSLKGGSITEFEKRIDKQRENEPLSDNNSEEFEIIPERIKRVKGRKISFDENLFMREALRILAREGYDFKEYGSKKRFSAEVRASYLVAKGKDDLPDDDTLIRHLSFIWKDRGNPDAVLITHKSE